MDASGFDALARSLAAPATRRGILGAALALAAGALGARGGRAQNGCPPGQTPNRKGECRCPAGTDACPDGCPDLKRDIANCGGCGRGCFGGECRKGECRCPAGFTLCGNTCRNLATDATNCGGCGVVCPAPASGTCQGASTCTAGVCGFRPLAGRTVCRASATPCDAAEECDGTSTVCPPDRPAAAGVPCRPAAGPCDVAESCDGTSFSCPNDARVPEGEPGGCPVGQGCYGGVCAECADSGDCTGGAICRSNTCVACLGLRATCDPADSLCCQDQTTVCLENGLVGRIGRQCCRPLGGACNQANDFVGQSDCCINSYNPIGGGGFVGPCGRGDICGGQKASCGEDSQCLSTVCRGRCANQSRDTACVRDADCNCDDSDDDDCIREVGVCGPKECA